MRVLWTPTVLIQICRRSCGKLGENTSHALREATYGFIFTICCRRRETRSGKSTIINSPFLRDYSIRGSLIAAWLHGADDGMDGKARHARAQRQGPGWPPPTRNASNRDPVGN